MSREFAAMYAAALLIGSKDKRSFEVSFPNPEDTYRVVDALLELGCHVKWDRFSKFVTVRTPLGWREHVA